MTHSTSSAIDETEDQDELLNSTELSSSDSVPLVRVSEARTAEDVVIETHAASDIEIKSWFLDFEADTIPLKVGIVGDSRVGKTALVTRFVDGRRDEAYMETLGVNIMEKRLQCGACFFVQLSVWDLGGNELETLLSVVCADANAMLFAFDLTTKSSLIAVKRWYKAARKLSTSFAPFLIGTKYGAFEALPSAYKRETTRMARKFAAKLKAPLIYCSSNEDINVKEVFQLVLGRVLGVHSDVAEHSDELTAAVCEFHLDSRRASVPTLKPKSGKRKKKPKRRVRTLSAAICVPTSICEHSPDAGATLPMTDSRALATVPELDLFEPGVERVIGFGAEHRPDIGVSEAKKFSTADFELKKGAGGTLPMTGTEVDGCTTIILVIENWVRNECGSVLFPTDLVFLIRDFGPFVIDSAILTPDESINLHLSAFEKGVDLSMCTLLFRGSDNGFEARTFHELCDDRGATLTVALTEFGHVVGGFTAVPWTSHGIGDFRRDSSAWLFVARMQPPHKQRIDRLPVILDKSPTVGRQVYHFKSCGPTFGSGCDLRIGNNCDKTKDSFCNCTGEYSFENESGGVTLRISDITGGTHNFRVVDYEVFLTQSVCSVR